ncbi:MAG: methyltransferase domain-containing protein [Novosphingobium sp.]
MTTPYDRVAYPTAVFSQTHPERLAVLAMLAGLDPVDPARARILEIGGGDCMNLMSIAASWPDCQAHGFDLSEAAIARGSDIAARAGLGNVSLAVEDICAAQSRYPARSFDYVIAHGVYAWVPDHVRRATMELIGHALSDRGVAFVSYNCMPGGHIRHIMREMLLNVIGDIEDPDEKIAATRDFLEDYAKPRDGDPLLTRTLREQAEAMLERPDAVLFHDELGDCFNPQSLAVVVAAGEGVGLKFLTDAGRNRHLDGFIEGEEPGSADPDAQVLRAAIRADYVAMRYFRQTAFVRGEQQPDRRIDANRIATLYLTTKLQRQEDGSFMMGKDSLEIPDEELALALERAAAAGLQRVRVADIATTPLQLRVILQLYAEWYVNLHPAPTPFPDRPGEYPQTSPLIRAMLEGGERMICTLDHGLLKIDQPELRALLMAADGTRSMAEVADAGHGIPPEEVRDALTAAAARALMRA